MKYYEVRRISKKEYIEKTGDVNVEKWEESSMVVDNRMYVATRTEIIDRQPELKIDSPKKNKEQK